LGKKTAKQMKFPCMGMNKLNRQSKIRQALLPLALLVVSCSGFATPALAQGPMANGQMYNQGQGNPGQGNQNGRPTDMGLIREWFNKYDMVRRQAQMSPQERAKADDLLSHGLQVFVPGEEKVLARNLLTNLVGKYDRACSQLKLLPLYPETGGLHRQYFNYFTEARNLFGDYLRVQNNLMVKDERGNSVMAGLIERKQTLEGTEQQAKALDTELRGRFGIAPYRF
jgi:hypothetical protein